MCVVTGFANFLYNKYHSFFLVENEKINIFYMSLSPPPPKKKKKKHFLYVVKWPEAVILICKLISIFTCLRHLISNLNCSCLGRPGCQVPRLLHLENIDSSILLLRKEYAWHIGGALSQQELEEWKLLYHSALNGLSFNTFLGSIS